MKKPPETDTKRKARPKRGTNEKTREASGAPEAGEPKNKPFAERFPEGKLSSAEVLGDNVRRLRTALGLSQVGLAKSIKADQSAIGLIELKRANPTLRTIERLADVLGTTVPELLSKPGRRRTRT